MIVVDANVAAALLFEQSGSDVADRLLREQPIWHAPVLWRSEMGSVVTAHLRRGLVTVGQAASRLVAAERIIPPRRLHKSNPGDVLPIVANSGCSWYDAEYIALARTLNMPLLTWDQQILEAYPDLATTPEVLLQQP